jgi:glutamyl-tRNA reductase
VDPAVSALAGVELHMIDDLERVVQGVFAQRRAELPAAYSILRGEVARFTRWLGARAIGFSWSEARERRCHH